MTVVDNEKKQTKPEAEIGGKLIEILDGLLKGGDWESSLFLRTMRKRIQDIIDETSGIVAAGQEDFSNTINTDKFAQLLPQGYMRIYILLYQTEGSKLANWQYALKALLGYNVSRPTYKDESHVQELIRSKNDVDRYGYAVINIKESDTYPQEQAPKDVFGHEMLVLKENAIKRENIVGFVHAARRRYSFVEGELVYQGEL